MHRSGRKDVQPLVIGPAIVRQRQNSRLALHFIEPATAEKQLRRRDPFIDTQLRRHLERQPEAVRNLAARLPA